MTTTEIQMQIEAMELSIAKWNEELIPGHYGDCYRRYVRGQISKEENQLKALRKKL